MPRLRPFEPVARKKPHQAPPSPTAKLDLWLQRASLIAQPLLLLVALATIKLTVIPLYEKALLDEALARREIELKKTTDKLDAHYRTLRWYIAKSFAVEAVHNCGYTEAEMAWLTRPFVATQHVPREPIDREKLQTNVGDCLRQLTAKTVELEDLRAADRESLQSAINRLATVIAPIQSKAAADYQEAPSMAAKEPQKYLRDGPFRREAEAYLRRRGTPLPRRDIVADATKDLRRGIVDGYTSQLIAAINAELLSWAKQGVLAETDPAE